MILKIHKRCTKWGNTQVFKQQTETETKITQFKIEVIISVQFKIQLETTLKLNLPHY